MSNCKDVRVIPIVKRFECKASECNHSCCKYWNIALDDDTKTEYSKCGGIKGICLKTIALRKQKDTVMMRMLNNDCIFHGKDKLCKLQKDGHSELMPLICRMYPRRSITMCGRTEVTLELSCEEAARLFVEANDVQRFIKLKENCSNNKLSSDSTEKYQYTQSFWTLENADEELLEAIDMLREQYIEYVVSCDESVEAIILRLLSVTSCLQILLAENKFDVVKGMLETKQLLYTELECTEINDIKLDIIIDILKSRIDGNSYKPRYVEFDDMLAASTQKLRDTVVSYDSYDGILRRFLCYQLLKKLPEASEDYYIIKPVVSAVFLTLTLAIMLSGSNTDEDNNGMANVISCIETVLSHNPEFDRRLMSEWYTLIV